MLIANRGEIARRVSRSCHALGLEPVVVFTEADALSLHVLESEHAVCLGPDKRAYTSVDAIVGVAVEHKCAASACRPECFGRAGLTRLRPVGFVPEAPTWSIGLLPLCIPALALLWLAAG